MKGNISKAKRNVPTMISQLADDVGYLKKTEASATYIPQIITNIQSCKVSTAKGKFYLTTARGGKLYIGGDPETVSLSGLMTPTEDTSAATKKYVDDTAPTKVSQLENDSKFIQNLSENPEQQIRINSPSFTLGTVTTTISTRGFSVTDSLNNEYISVLENESGEGIGSLTLKYLATPKAKTDAANKQYVDSAIASVKNPYTLIEEITVSEDTTSIERNAEPNGTAYAFTDVYYEIETVKGSGTGTILVSCNENLTCGQHACIVTSAGRFASGFIKIEHGFLTTEFVNFATKRDTVANKVSKPFMVLSKEAEKITQLRFHVTGVPTLIPIPAGTKIRIYGVRI